MNARVFKRLTKLHIVKTLNTQPDPALELLLLCVKRSQLGWFRQLIKVPPLSHILEHFQTGRTGRRHSWTTFLGRHTFEKPNSYLYSLFQKSEVSQILAKGREGFLQWNHVAEIEFFFFIVCIWCNILFMSQFLSMIPWTILVEKTKGRSQQNP